MSQAWRKPQGWYTVLLFKLKTSKTATATKNQNLADRIKELRIRKGFSQEQLSENSKLSQRTIQRLEKGESVPRGNTLVRLTKALGVTPDDVLDWQLAEDRSYLSLLNLSVLSVALHPLLGIIIPLVMWILKREKIEQVEDSGMKLLNFQITWTLVYYLSVVIVSGGLSIVLNYYNFFDLFPSAVRSFRKGGFAIIFLYLYNFVFIFINMRRNQRGLASKYLPAIPVLR